MNNLYELTSEFLSLIEKYNSGNFEDEDALIDEIELAQLDLDIKFENCVCYYKNLEADAELLKAEAKKLNDRAKTLINRADKFEQYLANCLKGKKWKNGIHEISYRKSEVVEIVDESLIPFVYLRTKQTVEPDKNEIKKHLKEGATIDGVKLVQKNNLQIK